MAGDWIKMREALHEDPAVLAMAERLETRPEHVVGYCHKFWSWVSRNCPDGVVRNVSLHALGSVLALPTFPEILCDVGWLLYVNEDGKHTITIPNFDRHLSQGAKARALASEKKRKQRRPDSVPILSRNCPRKTGTREEKRREEKSISVGVPTESARTQKPTCEEVQAYVAELGYTMDAEKFWHHFEARGWRTREGPLKSWKSAVVNWQKNEKTFGNQKQDAKPRAKLLTPEQEKLFTAETFTTGLLADGTSIL